MPPRKLILVKVHTLGLQVNLGGARFTFLTLEKTTVPSSSVQTNLIVEAKFASLDWGQFQGRTSLTRILNCGQRATFLGGGGFAGVYNDSNNRHSCSIIYYNVVDHTMIFLRQICIFPEKNVPDIFTMAAVNFILKAHTS